MKIRRKKKYVAVPPKARFDAVFPRDRKKKKKKNSRKKEIQIRIIPGGIRGRQEWKELRETKNGKKGGARERKREKDRE